MAEPQPAEVVARLEGIVAGYPTGPARRVLDGVDLALHAGERVALLGPNGAGKSTLLRVLAGTLAPERGRVELFGRPIAAWDRRELARSVTVLPQVADLPRGFRVAEVVALGRIPHARSWFAATPGDAEAVARALADADVADLADRRVEALSGGERQRVLLALALAQEPRLLLLDEPTTHLDLAHQFTLLALLERLRSVRRLTVLAVLHDLTLADRTADRVLILQAGRVVDHGRPGGELDPARLRDAFGVPIVEARTAEGRRVLVPGLPDRFESRIPD